VSGEFGVRRSSTRVRSCAERTVENGDCAPADDHSVAVQFDAIKISHFGQLRQVN
jgi:hypothetical protein